MRLFAYALREYDELGYLEECSRELGFEFGWTAEYPSLENVGLARGHEALCIITNPLDATLLDAFHEVGVRSVATRSIGYEHIDVCHAYALGMRVAHATYPPEGVADYTIMLMLMTLRKAKLVLRQARARDFSLTGKIGRDLASCTVGVVGTGQIGMTVIRELSGFGCRMLAFDPCPSAEVAGQAEYVALDALLAASDVVTLHAPATEGSYHMIDARGLGRMRPGAILVNAARGALVDTEALIDALEAGHLGGAALDTLEDEDGLCYLDRSREVLDRRQRAILDAMPNVIVSPHMAFYTETDVAEMVRSNVAALLDFEAGRASAYEVAH